MFELLEQKKNPNAKQDFEAIKKFINEETGFKFAYGTVTDTELTIRAVNK